MHWNLDDLSLVFSSIVILSRLFSIQFNWACCLPAWDAVGAPEEVESWVWLQWHGNGRYCIEATWLTGQPCFLQWYVRSLQEGAPVLGAQSIPVHESYGCPGSWSLHVWLPHANPTASSSVSLTSSLKNLIGSLKGWCSVRSCQPSRYCILQRPWWKWRPWPIIESSAVHQPANSKGLCARKRAGVINQKKLDINILLFQQFPIIIQIRSLNYRTG